MSQNYEDKSFGGNGSVFIKTTTLTAAPVNNYFHAIQVIGDAVFTSITGNITGDALTSVTFYSGQILYGNFSSFQLASGSVLAYKAR